MNPLLDRIKHWLSDGQAPAVPYEVACRCGALCRGQRRRQHQVVRCPQCGQRVFVLPQSPLATPAGNLTPPTVPAKARPVWLGPALAGGVSLLVMAALFYFILHDLVGHSNPPDQGDPHADALARLATARSALDGRDFARAQAELAAAGQLAQQHPEAFSRREQHDLAQLASEVRVLASWPGEPLDLIVGRSLKLREAEWQAVTDRYVGKGMVFDIEARRDATGSYTATFRKQAADQLLRLDLQNLPLLKTLPLNEPRRLVLGANLAELRRDEHGKVHVRLEPASAVLLTEPVLISACKPALDPDGLDTAIEQQRAWAQDLP